MNSKIPFYSEYFNLPNSLIYEGNNERKRYINNHIRSMCIDAYIYKFIPFDDNEDLNNIKLSMIRNKQLWASNHNYFEDKTETNITCNIYEISRKTGQTVETIKNQILIYKEMNDVSCFTYKITSDMWKNYANENNGVCLRFILLDTDKFYPISYLDKNKIDFTNWFIGAYKNLGTKLSFNYVEKLSILPWVMKHKDFSWENELRFLYGEAYDSEAGEMGGRIAPGKKRMMNYKGALCSYDYCGIQLNKIIVGEKCKSFYKTQLEKIIEENNYV